MCFTLVLQRENKILLNMIAFIFLCTTESSVLFAANFVFSLISLTLNIPVGENVCARKSALVMAIALAWIICF